MASKMKLDHGWIQDRDGVYEHFDLTVNMRVLAIRNGAKEITFRDMAELFEKKRKALGDGDETEGRG